MKKIMLFFKRNSIFLCILAAFLASLFIESCSRHSFISGLVFLRIHPFVFLYNTFLYFLIYSLVYLFKHRIFAGGIISVVFISVGIANGLVLTNRIAPLGFSDILMIPDLFTMTNTNYFPLWQAILCGIALVFAIYILIQIYKKEQPKVSRFHIALRIIFIICIFAITPGFTHFLRHKNVLTSYFGDVAKGYENYGFAYGFMTSAFDQGITKPLHYSDKTINHTMNKLRPEEVDDSFEYPNVIFVLLESFYDVEECKFLKTSEEVQPYFHYLENHYSSGYLTVPVSGAGTCNTEFEILTGMSTSFFAPGEYPQKTILKKTDCESYAHVFKNLGYTTHVVHNNGGNFYSRANAFSQMGFDYFQCKETLDITEYTPLDSWPTDDILVDATLDALKATDGPDFIYTITVEGHGDYPDYKVLDNPQITVNCVGKDEETNYKWEYYVNQMRNVDEFIQEYISAIKKLDEPTLVVFFGDHLPALDLVNSETAMNNIYQTQYTTWNNFHMDNTDENMYAYQLVSEYLDRLGVHTGTFNRFHQTFRDFNFSTQSFRYQRPMLALQYDILYGERYAYDGVDKYPASDIILGLNDVKLNGYYIKDDKIHILGKYFTPSAVVVCDGHEIETEYHTSYHLTCDSKHFSKGDEFYVSLIGPGNAVFRDSNTYLYEE